MSDLNSYGDPSVVEVLRDTGAPRVLTTRADGTPVYVALHADGHIVEVTP